MTITRKSNKAVMMRFKNDLFLKALDDIRRNRIKEGVDNVMRPRTQIAEAMARGLLQENLESFRAVKKDLILGKFRGEDE